MPLFIPGGRQKDGVSEEVDCGLEAQAVAQAENKPASNPQGRGVQKKDRPKSQRNDIQEIDVRSRQRRVDRDLRIERDDKNDDLHDQRQDQYPCQ